MTSYQRRFLRIRVTHSRSCYHRLVGTKRVTQGLGPEKNYQIRFTEKWSPDSAPHPPVQTPLGRHLTSSRVPAPLSFRRLRPDATPPPAARRPLVAPSPPSATATPHVSSSTSTSPLPPPPSLSFSYRSGWSLRLSSAQAGVAPGAAGGGGSGRGRQGSLRQRRMWPQLVSVTVCNLFSPDALQRRRVGSRAPASVRTLPLLSPSPQHLLLKQGLPDHWRGVLSSSHIVSSAHA